MGQEIAKEFTKSYISAEVEFKSKHFRMHRKQKVGLCDLLICWEHNAYPGMFMLERTKHLKVLVLKDFLSCIFKNKTGCTLFLDVKNDSIKWHKSRDSLINEFVEERTKVHYQGCSLFRKFDKRWNNDFFHNAGQKCMDYDFFDEKTWTLRHAFDIYFNTNGIRIYSRKYKRNKNIYSESDLESFDALEFRK